MHIARLQAWTAVRGMQLPDRRHTARELRDIPEKTFKDVIDAYLARGSESISMPSNLLLMYQATM